MARSSEELRAETANDRPRTAKRPGKKRSVGLRVTIADRARAAVTAMAVPSVPERRPELARTDDPIERSDTTPDRADELFEAPAVVRGDQAVEREKLYILWGSVTFFTALIVCFWLYTVQATFTRTVPVDGSITNRWNDLSQTVNEQVGAIKETWQTIETLTASGTAAIAVGASNATGTTAVLGATLNADDLTALSGKLESIANENR